MVRLEGSEAGSQRKVKEKGLFEVLTSFPPTPLLKPCSLSLAPGLDSSLLLCSSYPVQLFNEILRLSLPAFSLTSYLCMTDFGSTKTSPTLSSKLPWPPTHLSLLYYIIVLMSLQHLAACKVTVFVHLLAWLISVSPLWAVSSLETRTLPVLFTAILGAQSSTWHRLVFLFNY